MSLSEKSVSEKSVFPALQASCLCSSICIAQRESDSGRACIHHDAGIENLCPHELDNEIKAAFAAALYKKDEEAATMILRRLAKIFMQQSTNN